MGDRFRTFFVFERPWEDGALEDFVGFLSDEFTVTVPPGFEYGESVRAESEITSPSHYVEELTSGYGSIDVELDRGIRTGLLLTRDPEQSAVALDYPGFHFSISDNQFFRQANETDEEAAERIDELYELFTAVYQYCTDRDRTPLYVYGLSGEDQRRIGHPDYDVDVSGDRIKDRKMPGVYWCQIVPPAIVEAVGKDTLLAVPVYRVEELDDGGILIVLHHYPVEETEEKEVADYLGVPYDIPY